MRLKDTPGQTLVELIAAAFVLAFGLVGALALTTANVRNQTIGNIRLVASQLAREGVELARNIRDTNWIQGNEWDVELRDSSNNLQSCAVVNETVDGFRFVPCADNIFLDPFSVYRFNDLLVQLGASQQGAVKTQYYRIVRLDPICLNKTEQDLISGNLADTVETIEREAPGCTNVKAGIQVTSEVGWIGAGGSQSTKVVESIYNWR